MNEIITDDFPQPGLGEKVWAPVQDNRSHLVIQPLSTSLMKPNFHYSLSRRRSATVSSETTNLFFVRF